MLSSLRRTTTSLPMLMQQQEFVFFPGFSILSVTADEAVDCVPPCHPVCRLNYVETRGVHVSFPSICPPGLRSSCLSPPWGVCHQDPFPICSLSLLITGSYNFYSSSVTFSCSSNIFVVKCGNLKEYSHCLNRRGSVHNVLVYDTRGVYCTPCVNTPLSATAVVSHATPQTVFEAIKHVLPCNKTPTCRRSRPTPSYAGLNCLFQRGINNDLQE